MNRLSTVGAFIAELQQYPQDAEVKMYWRTSWHSVTNDYPFVLASSELDARLQTEAKNMAGGFIKENFAGGATGFPLLAVSARKITVLDQYMRHDIVKALYHAHVIWSGRDIDLTSAQKLIGFLTQLLEHDSHLNQAKVYASLEGYQRDTLQSELQMYMDKLKLTADQLLQVDWHRFLTERVAP